mmetsp:Transcript_23392/g.64616  ORF Transcript_23392/g.64616 Transcript_23392/m.64616 type:complete len:221 (-) Transcript_23392:2466-3128(-)
MLRMYAQCQVSYAMLNSIQDAMLNLTQLYAFQHSQLGMLAFHLLHAIKLVTLPVPQIRLNKPDSFCLHSMCTTPARVSCLVRWAQSFPRGLTHMYHPSQASTFHACSKVDGVPKEAEAWALASGYARSHGSRVHADAQHHWLPPRCRHLHFTCHLQHLSCQCEQVVHRTAITIPQDHRAILTACQQARSTHIAISDSFHLVQAQLFLGVNQSVKPRKERV